jgi:hypothetical protein
LHKGPLRNWQNTAVLRRGLGMDVVFYVLHRDGIPLANMMTVEHRGVGHFGHVWTQPEDRRKGAASLIMDAQMADFKRRGGQALFLGTGYNSAPYHIYAARGFVGLEAESGYMASTRAIASRFIPIIMRRGRSKYATSRGVIGRLRLHFF